MWLWLGLKCAQLLAASPVITNIHLPDVKEHMKQGISSQQLQKKKSFTWNKMAKKIFTGIGTRVVKIAVSPVQTCLVIFAYMMFPDIASFLLNARVLPTQRHRKEEEEKTLQTTLGFGTREKCQQQSMREPIDTSSRCKPGACVSMWRK